MDIMATAPRSYLHAEHEPVKKLQNAFAPLRESSIMLSQKTNESRMQKNEMMRDYVSQKQKLVKL